VAAATGTWRDRCSTVVTQLANYAVLRAHLGDLDVADSLGREALDIYRRSFRPSDRLAKPHVMIAVGVSAAATDDEATYLRSSQLLAFARLRTGQPGKLPHPTRDLSAIPAPILEQASYALSCSAVGSPATVRQQLTALIARYQPDEIMITGMMHDPAARVRSLQIAAEVLSDLVTPAAAA